MCLKDNTDLLICFSCTSLTLHHSEKKSRVKKTQSKLDENNFVHFIGLLFCITVLENRCFLPFLIPLKTNSVRLYISVDLFSTGLREELALGKNFASVFLKYLKRHE